jgi:hypothetical protein
MNARPKRVPSAPEDSGAADPDSFPWIAVGAIFALAAILRFAAIGKSELWVDEMYSVVTALSPRGVLRGAMWDNNPPLYFHALRGWIAPFGISAAAVRSLSAVLGLVQLAAMGLWLRRFGLPRGAVLWALLIGALTPLHVYYCQEARSYTLLYLLATLAMWSFTAAAAPSARISAWLAHAAVLIAGLYTQNIFAFLLPVFWAGAWALRLDRRGWGMMLGAQTLAALLYLPWLVVTRRVIGEGSLTWIGEAWDPSTAPLSIPQSLETLGYAGRLPRIVRMLAPPAPVRWLGLVWFLIVLAMAARAARPPAPDLPRSLAGLRRQSSFLALFAVGPLLMILLFSYFIRPIYVVGRYDTVIFPALFGLTGIGAAALSDLLRRRTGMRFAAILVSIVPLLIAETVLIQKYRPLPSGALRHLHHPQEARGEVLRDYARPGDLIVCLGLEGVKGAYISHVIDLDADLLTYPLDTQDHLGFFDHQRAAANPEALRTDARAILDRFDVAGRPERRLFVLLDPYAFRQPTAEGTVQDHTRIATTLLDTLEGAGLVPWNDPEFRTRTAPLGIRTYVRPD